MIHTAFDRHFYPFDRVFPERDSNPCPGVLSCISTDMAILLAVGKLNVLLLSLSPGLLDPHAVGLVFIR